MLDIITIGSATKDAFLVSKDFKLIRSKDFSTGIGECFAYGAKIEIADIIFSTGGGATNAAATMANLGIKAGVYTEVGQDLFGHEIIEDLKFRGIDIHNLHFQSKLKTGYSTILLLSAGDRTILVYRGASDKFDPRDLEAKNLKAKWIYLTGVAGHLPFVKKVLQIAGKNESNVFWNPGGGELKYGLKTLEPLLRQVQILSLNKEEAQKLTGEKDVRKNLEILGAIVPLVWITDGKVGAYLSAAGARHFVPSLGTPALNTTGAGDAFGSGFVAGLILKDDWQFAARLAILNSDGVVRQMGAKTGLLTELPGKSRLSKVKIKNLK